MEASHSGERPLACELSALNQEEQQRRQKLQEEIRSALQERRELADGYAFRYPADGSTLLKLAEFVALERRCCPFFSFKLKIEAEQGPIWFEVSGRQGVKSFLQAELGLG